MALLSLANDGVATKPVRLYAWAGRVSTKPAARPETRRRPGTR